MWPLVLTAGLVLVALVAALGYAITRQLERSHDREIRQVAIQRAQIANELGSALPVLTAEQMRRGFTAAELRSVAVAEERLKRSQPLRGLAIFDSRRRLVYPAAGGIQFTVPEGINRALRGSPAVQRHGGSEDPSIEASVPILDVDGVVIGVLVVELDEDDLRAVGGDERRVLITLVAAAILLWLVLLPFSVRVARMVAPSVSLARWRTLRGVRAALSTGGLEVHYQPKVAVATRLPSGAEGLVRWRRGESLLSPAAFLPHVETSDLVHDLTAFVLDRAVADAIRWRAAGHDLGVSVNLAPRSFEDDTLPALVQATLTKHGLEPRALTLEVTETAVLEDPSRVEAVLRRVADLGVAISIDDFGTGHSSLERLQRFPISEIKIDRSFIARMTADERPFVDSIAKLATALDLDVVAEGVEDVATLDLLAKTACGSAQGYFFCRPVPFEQLVDWLERPHAADIAALEKLGMDPDMATVEALVEAARTLSGGEVAWLARFDTDGHVVATVRGDPSFFTTPEGDPIALSESYCARMVEGEIPNAIPDARQHPATRRLDVTARAGLGSYVGVPVRLPDGERYGSLCSASRAAQAIPPETVRLLNVLAGLIGERMTNAPAEG